MTKIKAIIFDMDGVLIDAKDWHYESLNMALSLFGYSISRHEHLTTFDGLPTKNKLNILSIEHGLPTGLHTLINDLKQIYTMEMIYTKCKPVFAHQRALSNLKTEGYKIAVCSNSITKTIELMMEKADLLKFLDFFLSNQDVKKAKPDPEMYINAMKKLDLSPKECLICEDNENGIKAAIASGGHLMEIQTTTDVNYENIKARIFDIENDKDLQTDSLH